MRRAVKDYRYEIGESRMSEECAQYLSQLQKDWERHRVKVGVESMRKEVGSRQCYAKWPSKQKTVRGTGKERQQPRANH